MSVPGFNQEEPTSKVNEVHKFVDSHITVWGLKKDALGVSKKPVYAEKIEENLNEIHAISRKYGVPAIDFWPINISGDVVLGAHYNYKELNSKASAFSFVSELSALLKLSDMSIISGEITAKKTEADYQKVFDSSSSIRVIG